MVVLRAMVMTAVATIAPEAVLLLVALTVTLIVVVVVVVVAALLAQQRLGAARKGRSRRRVECSAFWRALSLKMELRAASYAPPALALLRPNPALWPTQRPTAGAGAGAGAVAVEVAVEAAEAVAALTARRPWLSRVPGLG